MELFAQLIEYIIIMLLVSLFYPTPFTDSEPVSYRSFPWATVSLIAINTVIFAAWMAPDLRLLTGQQAAGWMPYFTKIFTYGYRETALRDGLAIGAFSTFTATFLHGSYQHLFGNMLFLWTFGRRVEDACGPWRFALFYLSVGMLAHIGSVVLTRSVEWRPAIGASGAIAGVMGAYLLLLPGSHIRIVWGIGSVIRVPYAVMRGLPVWRWTLSVPGALLLIFFVINDAIPSFRAIEMGELQTRVGHLAHFSGFLAALTVFLFVRKDVLRRYISGRNY